MANRLKIYYPKSQITNGLLTLGGEWMLEDGTEYSGPYHKYADGNVLTGSIRNVQSVLLFPFKPQSAPDKKYKEIVNVQVDKYIAPRYYVPQPTAKEFEKGWFNRYFVFKRNQPITSIIEVDEKQYSSLSFNNEKKIDNWLYSGYLLRWRLTGPREEITETNRNKVFSSESKIPGISSYLTNLIEFSKYSPVWQL